MGKKAAVKAETATKASAKRVSRSDAGTYQQPSGEGPAALEAAASPCVLLFHSEREGRQFREFSNFYIDVRPFPFVLPAFAQREGWPESAMCKFSEKAIMLTKAALMGDKEMFSEIERAGDPKSCNALGRGVRGFDQDLWEQHLHQTAFAAVRQKFEASGALQEVLLSTGNAVLAKAAPSDFVWGIGLGCQDAHALQPAQWRGRNVLGLALMRVRSLLRGRDSTLMSAVAALAPFGVPGAALGGAAGGGPPGVAAAAAAPRPVREEPEAEAEGGLGACVQSVVGAEEDYLRPVSDLEAVRACYERYGVVGVTGALSAEECRNLIVDGIEPFLPEGCHMDDPATYGLAGSAMNRFGVIGKSALFSPAICSARLHPNVVGAYAAVHGRDDIVAGHDRVAWMRPVGVDPSWDTPFSWPGLHFDISLQSYFGGSSSRSAVDEYLRGICYESNSFQAENNAKHHSMGRTVQGVLNLLDNGLEDGGFHCVPGMFGESVQRWVQGHQSLPAPEVNGKYVLKGVGPDAQLGKRAVRVPCPAGTLLLFDATLPHGTRPNLSLNSRAILFLRYLTPDELPAEAWQKRNAALRHVMGRIGFRPDTRQAKHLYGPEC
mmetsp:Transcript_112697/g.313527  ORF Transcript_112697/g.313527 Transcript_112697/m.313527 type:complete len:605 (+) Transcript_112697:92-1906(+)|eukprot:CAMPEP_0179033448 /NCGR_PEP_ID=MMETSP0796-20121207/12109_1 /TAXON_ID=73915 /ORGANISM="Pyrodinium bahamense, Strain pbaha01" /LENGTH=604 /DNA_ID=CAMNT_0020729707 /DNA_START=91 /DNA_END=1905 /DNA_ORIENTATION=+